MPWEPVSLAEWRDSGQADAGGEAEARQGGMMVWWVGDVHC